jgi:hypothetical protein
MDENRVMLISHSVSITMKLLGEQRGYM